MDFDKHTLLSEGFQVSGVSLLSGHHGTQLRQRKNPTLTYKAAISD